MIKRDDKHKYFVALNGAPAFGDPWAPVAFNVTSVLDVLNKPVLMYWAANMAVEAMKEKIKPGKSYSEIALAEMFEEAKGAHRKRSRAGMNRGQLVHSWIEAGFKAPEAENALPVDSVAASCCQEFVKICKERKITISDSERPVYDRKEDCAGTVDALGEMLGMPVRFDFKVSSGMYVEYTLQQVAYGKMLELEGIHTSPWIFLFDRETGKPELIPVKITKEGEGAWLGALKISRWLKQMKEKV